MSFDLEILYKDNHLLIVNKPSGIPTQSSEHHPVSVETWARSKGHTYCHAVQRLDKDTSGIVILALSSKSLQRMHQKNREHSIEKKYTATIEGAIHRGGTLVHYLEKHNHYASAHTRPRPQRKKSLLTFVPIKTDEHYSVLEVQTLTGRYHQIRAQLSAIGHPIVGDTKYGGQAARTFGLTHSWTKFTHPVTKELLTISCFV